MLEIFLYISAPLLTALCFYYSSRFWKANANLGFLATENELLQEKLTMLEGIRLENTRKLQELESANKHLEAKCADQEKSQKEAFASAKAALFDLGGELSKQLLEVHKQENKQSREMSEQRINQSAQKFHTEFERIVQMVSELNKDVDNSKSTLDIIKQSLLSPSGAGYIAEITLENILKASGLRNGIDFFMQHTIAGTSDNKLRPDAVIKLPGNNIMVVDAKASKFLVEMGGTEDREGKAKLMKAMNFHLKSLASKEYVDNIINSFNLKNEQIEHAMMLMFLPTEYAIDKITNIEPEFISRAWGLNIFPVGPSGLMNMLSFAKFQINDNMRSSNHYAIIEEVRKLIASISILTDYSQKIGSNIQALVNNYDKFSASFNRNFLPKVFSIQKLGIDMGQKKAITSLTRYQLVSSKSELIDAESIDAEQEEEA
ncbi:MAG UNVERIFIED_CONTAM: DNA recombination protein RmuC [Planctomycetaceae bacterium]|jgi:DNA recombination protein RmuC